MGHLSGFSKLEILQAESEEMNLHEVLCVLTSED